MMISRACLRRYVEGLKPDGTPNSLIVVRAEAALHRVLGVRRGEREIVKAVYVSASPRGGDEKLPAYFANLDAYLT